MHPIAESPIEHVSLGNPQLSYSLFGLNFRSNIVIPNLVPTTPAVSAFDVNLVLGTSPPSHDPAHPSNEVLAYTSSFLDESGSPTLRIWRNAEGALLRLAFCDGHQFWMNDDGSDVWAVWPESSCLEDSATYLLGPVLGILLRRRGMTCLHASAVAWEGKAVAFVGDAGAGKSTTAAMLIENSWTGLSDDIVALEEIAGGFVVAPAYPYLSLWPESVNMIYGSREALPRFVSNWDKCRMDLADDDSRFAAGPLPLLAIYILSGEAAGDGPMLKTVSRPDALLNLIPNTYATNVLDSQMRAREFAFLGRIISKVPVRKLFARSAPDKGGALHRLLSRDLEALTR